MENYIYEIPNLVPTDLCTRIIIRFETDNRKCKGAIHQDYVRVVDEKLKKNVELFITGKSGWEDIDTEISKYISIGLKKYFSHLHTTFEDKNKLSHIYKGMICSKFEDTGYDIQRIARGDSYAWHHDDNWYGIEGRVLNCLLYLNTLEDHEGGKTELLGGTKIQPQAGKLLIFPCSWTFPHCGNEVKGDYKYICCSSVRICAPSK
jgi:hypothetical protein